MSNSVPRYEILPHEKLP